MKKRKQSLGAMVSPQAILWRPIRYFSDAVFEEVDELDKFKFVGYTNNNTPFDVRNYRGHPAETVTLYLPSDINQDDAIQEQIDTAIRALQVPETALAWRRGQEFQYGGLERQSTDRLIEREARILVLKIVSTFDNHRASTGDIKELVPKFYALSNNDLAPSPTRRHEAVWRQIIGNVKVHHAGSRSIFSQGLAERVPKGIALTGKGYDYLKSLGFVS